MLVIHLSRAEETEEQNKAEENHTGLVGMVRSVTKSVPPNLSIGPFNIDTRNYANTIVNLCRAMFIDF